MKKLLATGLFATALVFTLPGRSSAEEVRMVATLTGGEETPAPLLTGALGTAEVVIDTTKRTVVVALNIFNIPTGTTAGHIHVGPKGVQGPVVIDFGFPAGRTGDFPITFSLTVREFRARPEIGINTIEDALQAIVGGNAYVNVHTSQLPGGEIRGQILPIK